MIILRTPLYKYTDLILNSNVLMYFEDPMLKDALYNASPVLYRELEKIENGKIANTVDNAKIIESLYKYIVRAHTRCTPFGLFAGISTLKWGEKTNVQFSDVIPRLRLDMDYVCNLYNELSKNEEVISHISYFPNSTLYKVDKKWRYIEYKTNDNARIHELVSVDDNSVLSAIIEKTKDKLKFNQILSLVKRFGIDELTARTYIKDLIHNQILVNELYPSVTGVEYQSSFFSILDSIAFQGTERNRESLTGVLVQSSPLKEKTGKIKYYLETKFTTPVHEDKLIQVDLFKNTSAGTLDCGLKSLIQESTQFLLRLAKQQNSYLLDNFKNAFLERYEDRFKPLVKVLDTDIGIGYRNAKSTTPIIDTSNDWDKEMDFKLSLYSQSLKNSLKSIDLSENIVNSFIKFSNKQLPSSYYFTGSIIYKKDGTDKDFMLVYDHSAGPSAINLVGRFSHLDVTVAEFCKKLASEEQELYKDVILFEVAHLPEGRVGNVVSRAHFRDFELPYLSKSELPSENQILPDELYVGIRNNRVILYSTKLKKEVIPRLSTAHNFTHNSLPLYHFLCDLQKQNVYSQIHWDWGVLGNQPFLPRIMYKNVVLSSAKWNIQTANIDLSIFSEDYKTFVSYVDKIGIPMKFLLVQGDNKLYINLENDISRNVFKSYVKKEKFIRISEFLFGQNENLSGFTNELVIPFINDKFSYTSSITNVLEESKDLQIKSPFSEWIYFKLYTGRKFANSFLSTTIYDLCNHLYSQGLIQRFFFVRYSDPNDHIRLRFKLYDKSFKGKVMNVFESAIEEYIQEDVVWELQISTYKRELERYGVKTIDYVEELFSIDSQIVLLLLRSLHGKSEVFKIIVAVKRINDFLDIIFLSIDEKLKFIRRNINYYSHEFNLEQNKSLRKKISSDYRANADRIQSFIANISSDRTLSEPLTILAENEQDIRDLLYEIQKHHAVSKMQEIMSGILHMFINRLFSQDQRYFELVAYIWTEKLILSLIAQKSHSDETH